MEPTIPTSFIPKRPVTTEPVAQPKRSSRAVGLLSILAIIIVLATAAAYVFVYMYAQQLQSKKDSLSTQIEEAKRSIGTDFVKDMQRLNVRIDGVRYLLNSHVVVSPIFASLERSTLRSVQYKSFTYDMKTDTQTGKQMVQVKLTGTAKSYAMIALQSDAYLKESLIKNPVFSGLTIDDKTGLVGFTVTFMVSPSDVSYASFITSQQASQSVPNTSTL